jgi:amidohydrolase
MHSRRVRALAALAALAIACEGAREDAPGPSEGPGDDLREEVERRARAVVPRVIDWRRDLHQRPELSNREFRTAALVAKQLEALGLDVRTGVAHTGVVAVLQGGGAAAQRAGKAEGRAARRSRAEIARTAERSSERPVVALRADMDALPVTEELDLPFASKLRAEHQGREVGVMHACGHDAHTAILLGTAEVLAGVRDRLPGTVVFLFQPAEERPPPGEDGGAKLMIEEGVLDDPTPEAIFALHAVPQHEVGTLAYRPGGVMASSDRMRIRVTGRQTHAAYPWLGVDSIAVASRLVLALQAIPGREVDARIPAVVSIGQIHGGVRHNIIPQEVELVGTIRALDPEQREEIHARVRRVAQGIADSAGASVHVEIEADRGYPVTVNDAALGRRMRPTLERVAGADSVATPLPRTGSEDFGHFAQRIPGFYFWLGVRPRDVSEAEAASNHSPRFFVDEGALGLGVRAMSALAADYLVRAAAPSRGAPGEE